MAQQNSYILAEEMNTLINTYKDLYAYAESTSQPSISGVSKTGISYASAINTIINGMNNLKTKYGTAFASYTAWKTKVAKNDFLTVDINNLQNSMKTIRSICKELTGATTDTKSPSTTYSPDRTIGNNISGNSAQSTSKSTYSEDWSDAGGDNLGWWQGTDTNMTQCAEYESDCSKSGNGKTTTTGNNVSGDSDTGYYESVHSAGNSKTTTAYTQYSY